MSDQDFGYQWEKSRHIIEGLCHILEHTKTVPVEFPAGKLDLRDDFHALLWDATKLFCQAVEAHHRDSHRWSPELVSYLFQHPENCDETLRILESEDYRDGYYDKAKF